MQGTKTLPPLAQGLRHDSYSDSEEEEACWICLSSAGILTRPCNCPRFCHRECIATWQLTNYGRRYLSCVSGKCYECVREAREENFCRFCNKRLPALWKPDTTQEVAKEELKVAPVMAVRYNGPEGTREFKLRVKPGPEGLAMFKAHLKDILGFEVGSEFDVTFECQMPATGSMLTLSGLNAYGAATHCAALLAASKTGGAAAAAAGTAPVQPSTPPQRTPTSTSASAQTRTSSSFPTPAAAVAALSTSALAPGASSPTYMASGAPGAAVSRLVAAAAPQPANGTTQSPSASATQRPLLPSLSSAHTFTTEVVSRGAAAVSLDTTSRRACQTGYMPGGLSAGGSRSSDPTAAAGSSSRNQSQPLAPTSQSYGFRSQYVAGRRSTAAYYGGGGVSSALDRCMSPLRAASHKDALETGRAQEDSEPVYRARRELRYDLRACEEEEQDGLDDLLPCGRNHVVPEPPSVMPLTAAAAGEDQQQPAQVSRRAGAPEPRRRPRSTPTAPGATSRTRGLLQCSDGHGYRQEPADEGRASDAPGNRFLMTSSDLRTAEAWMESRSVAAPVTSSSGHAAIALPRAPLSAGAGTEPGSAAGGSGRLEALVATSHGRLLEGLGRRKQQPSPQSQPGMAALGSGVAAGEQQQEAATAAAEQGLQQHARGPASTPHLHLPTILKSTAKRTMDSLRRVLGHTAR